MKNNIRKIRKRKGLTQEALGKLIGVGQTQISHWENASYLRDSTIKKISDALECDVSDLMSGTLSLGDILDVLEDPDTSAQDVADIAARLNSLPIASERPTSDSKENAAAFPLDVDISREVWGDATIEDIALQYGRVQEYAKYIWSAVPDMDQANRNFVSVQFNTVLYILDFVSRYVRKNIENKPGTVRQDPQQAEPEEK